MFILQARELKSIHLNAEGQILKLLIHQNHVNKFNLYNQVSPYFKHFYVNIWHSRVKSVAFAAISL